MKKDWNEIWNNSEGNLVYLCDENRDDWEAKTINGIETNFELKPNYNLLDFGCGITKITNYFKKKVSKVFLYDSSLTVSEKLKTNYRNDSQITVLDKTKYYEQNKNFFDIIYVGSVLQYLSKEQLKKELEYWETILNNNGCIILADVITPDISIFKDVFSALQNGHQGKYLFKSLNGLIKLFFSDYLSTRNKIPLTKYSLSEIRDYAFDCKLVINELRENICLNKYRKTLILKRENN